MNIHDSLHDISEQSGASQSNLWYQIEAQLEEENLMEKAKRKQKPTRLHLNWVAALIAVIFIGTVAFGARSRPQYDIVTMDDIAEMATPINESMTVDDVTLTVDWAYADPNQIFVAYSITDADGNDLIPTSYENIMSELIVKWNDDGEYSSFGTHYQHATYGTQYIQHVATPYTHFNSILRSGSNAPDFNERTMLNLQLRSGLDNVADRLSPYKIDIDVPYGAIHYTASNNINDDFFYNSLETSDDTNDSSINDIVITNSGISILMCTPLPDGLSRSLIFSDSAELSVNNQAIDNTLLWQSNISFNLAVYDNMNQDINEDGDLPYCNYFVWRIAFEELPNQLQFRIPTLAIAETFDPAEIPDYLATYIDLYADLGYDITIDTESDPPYLADYGSDWEALYPDRQFTIERYVYLQILEQYPPETTPYALDWEYTYDLRD